MEEPKKKHSLLIIILIIIILGLGGYIVYEKLFNEQSSTNNITKETNTNDVDKETNNDDHISNNDSPVQNDNTTISKGAIGKDDSIIIYYGLDNNYNCNMYIITDKTTINKILSIIKNAKEDPNSERTGLGACDSIYIFDHEGERGYFTQYWDIDNKSFVDRTIRDSRELVTTGQTIKEVIEEYLKK